MAIELERTPITGLRVVNRSMSQHIHMSGNIVKLVSSRNLDQSRTIASKISFQATMERASLSQKYWNDLLEKLRKAGGGGGGSDPKFDRVAVSMSLMNFLSNKTIQAILRNFTGDFLNSQNLPTDQKSILNFTAAVNALQLGNFSIKHLLFSVLTIGAMSIKTLTKPINSLGTQLIGLISTVSFQLNKLKEILDQELKEAIRRLDVKEKMKKIKTVLIDFFVEMRKELLDVIDCVKDNLNKIVNKFSIFVYGFK